MKRSIPQGLPRSAWIVLVALLLFRAITYALTDFSAAGDGVSYMKVAGFIGKHHILPPLSIQPYAYPWLLSWFQVHKDPAAALQRIGRTQQVLDASIVITLCWLAMKLLGRTKPWLLVGAWTLIVLQPFTGIWSRTIYTEQTVSFLSFAGFLVLSASLFNRQSKSISLLGVGAAGTALGLASILRSDVLALNTVLLLGIILYLAFLAGNWLRWRKLKILTLIFSYIAMPLVMSSYQYASSGEFGTFNNNRDIEGYFGWIRTWPANPREYQVFAFLSQRHLWTLDNYPAKAFDSTEEKIAFSNIMEQWQKQSLASSAQIDAQFQALTKEKIRKNPIRHYILNPVQRMYYYWVNRDGSQFYVIPYGLRSPVSTAVAGLIFLARLLMIALFIAGLTGLILKLKQDRWCLSTENWLFFFCLLSCVYVLLRTFELGVLSSFMIAGLMEVRFISIAMPFFLMGALVGARQLIGREPLVPRLADRAR